MIPRFLSGRSPAGSLLTVFALAALAAPALSASIATRKMDPSMSRVEWSGTVTGTRAVHQASGKITEATERLSLVLQPGDYTDLQVQVAITAAHRSDDYDVRVFDADGELLAVSAGPTPLREATWFAIDPPFVQSARTYSVEVVATDVRGGGYTGQVELSRAQEGSVPLYTAGTLTFARNVPLVAGESPTDGEPSVRVDVRGNCYVGGIRGVPAGVDLWRIDLDPTSPGFDPVMQNAVYLGQPDAFVEHDPGDTTVGGADGGGDIEISVSFPSNPTDIPVLTVTSLALANISSAVSTDRGDNFTLAPFTTITTADDREWNESTGDSLVYLLWRAPIPATALWVAKSTDHGLTFPNQNLVNPSGTTPGYIDVDHSNGRVYVAHSSGTTGLVSYSTNQGQNWFTSTAHNGGNHGELFDVVKVGNDGTVYFVWCNRTDIFMTYSTNQGISWAQAIKVNDDTVYQTNVLPWIEAGDAGRIAIIWYGTTNSSNNDNADWDVLYAQCLNAMDPNPVFRQQVISDHKIHAGSVSLGGLGGAANRNLLDYFQVALDTEGASVVAFADDHCDYLANTFVTRQLDGESLYANANGTGFVNPVSPTPLPVPAPGEPEVSDLLHDVVIGLVQPVATDDPHDILWVDLYCTTDSTSGDMSMFADIKVSDLTVVPAASNWRVDFVANAPNGHCDRGDHFWMTLNTDDPQAPVVSYGKSARDADGGYHVRTTLGTGHGAAFDTTNFIITLGVEFNELNQWVTAGPPITTGSLIEGIKADAREGGGNAGLWDVTHYGAGKFTVGSCGQATSVPDVERQPLASFLSRPFPNPMSTESSVRFVVDRPGFVELSVFDVTGRRVRTIQAGPMNAGEYVRGWDGQTDRWGVNAAPGVYFMVLNTSGGQFHQKITLVE